MLGVDSVHVVFWDFKNGPIRCFKGALSEIACSKSIDALDQLEYGSLKIDGVSIRDEAKITDFSVPAIKKQLHLISELAASVGYEDYSVESYCGKYNAGQYAPPHRDTSRNKVVCIAYVGTFSGGEFWYEWGESIPETTIDIENGDVLICVNEANGETYRPRHGTKPVLSGNRYALMTSLIVGEDH